MSNEELLIKFEEVHNTWYTIENLIRMVENWEEKKSGRRSGPLLDIGGTDESKRWTLLEEGERLDNVLLKGRTLDRGSEPKETKKEN
ncbi:unnamed protein product [Arctia plantaginis]|uniref:Uncharacterized protein n=1 Tax=Arctia plantaginis TaxID=874455 RepID=A0A8S0YZW5_ARCPL|nr:unnamed protein product [Arctia plantaginis]